MSRVSRRIGAAGSGLCLFVLVSPLLVAAPAYSGSEGAEAISTDPDVQLMKLMARLSNNLAENIANERENARQRVEQFNQKRKAVGRELLTSGDARKKAAVAVQTRVASKEILQRAQAALAAMSPPELKAVLKGVESVIQGLSGTAGAMAFQEFGSSVSKEDRIEVSPIKSVKSPRTTIDNSSRTTIDGVKIATTRGGHGGKESLEVTVQTLGDGSLSFGLTRREFRPIMGKANLLEGQVLRHKEFKVERSGRSASESRVRYPIRSYRTHGRGGPL